MFFKNQKRNPFSAYRAFMSPYKWTSSVMACQTVVNLASRSNHFKCKQFDSLSFSTPSKFCVIILMIFRVSITCSCFYRLLIVLYPFPYHNFSKLLFMKEKLAIMRTQYENFHIFAEIRYVLVFCLFF